MIDLFQTISMFFWLRICSDVFQYTMSEIIIVPKQQFYFVHLRNIIIYFKTSKKQIFHIHKGLLPINNLDVALTIRNNKYFLEKYD